MRLRRGDAASDGHCLVRKCPEPAEQNGGVVVQFQWPGDPEPAWLTECAAATTESGTTKRTKTQRVDGMVDQTLGSTAVASPTGSPIPVSAPLATVVQAQGLTVAELLETDPDLAASQLRKSGYTAEDLQYQEVDISELASKDAGYAVDDLIKLPSVDAKTLLDLGYTVEELRAGGVTAAELLAAGVSADKLRAAGYSEAEILQRFEHCDAGQYFNLDQDRCWDCLPGTFAGEPSSGDGYRLGTDSRSGCPGYCPSGYTTPAGATTADQCFVSYMIMSGDSDTSAWCAGARNTDPDKFLWNNQGYKYVVRRVDCREAAKLLNFAEKIDVLELDDSCESYAAQWDRCSGLVGSAEHASCMAGAGADCAVTGSDQAPGAPALGYCGIEHDGAAGSEAVGEIHRVVFYTLPEGRQPGKYFTAGSRFTAICKVHECNSLQQVRGDGASRPADGSGSLREPTGSDNAECEPNPAQFAQWSKEEADSYEFFYLFLITMSIIIAVRPLQQFADYTVDAARSIFAPSDLVRGLLVAALLIYASCLPLRHVARRAGSRVPANSRGVPETRLVLAWLPAFRGGAGLDPGRRFYDRLGILLLECPGTAVPVRDGARGAFVQQL